MKTAAKDLNLPALAALLVIALLVRLPGLNESLWGDELWATHVIIGSLGDLLRVSLYDIHPPVYNAISFAWWRVFGDSEVSVRMIPLLCGLATVALMPALGASLATRQAGWLAGVLLALSPVHIWYSQEARAYATVMLVAVLVVLAWRRLDAEPVSRAARILFVAGCIVIAQLHYYGIAIPAVFTVMSLWQRRHRAVVLTGMALSLACIGALFAIKTASGGVRLEAGYLGTFTPAEAAKLFTSWFPLGGSVGLSSDETMLASLSGWLFVVITTGALLAWLAIGWRSGRERWVSHVLLLIATPGVLLTLWLIGRRGFYIERSALIALPFYFLAVAAAIWMIKREAIRRAVIALTVLASAVILVHYNGRRDRRTVYRPNPDWRSVVAPALAERETPEQHLVLLSTSDLPEARYYLPGAGECTWPPDKGNPAAGFRGKLAQLFPSSVRLTCGPGGTATTRLYVVHDSTLNWIDAVRAYEPDAKVLLVRNYLRTDITTGVIRALEAAGRPPRPIALVRALEVYALSPDR